MTSPLAHLTTAAAALTIASGALGAQRLATPTTAPADSAFPIRATGLPPANVVTLRAAMTDSANRVWTARADFRVAPDGTIDTGRDEPLPGSDYTGRRTLGLVTSMDLAGDARGRERYTPASLAELPLAVALVVDGQTVDSARVLRSFVASGTTVTPVDSAGIVGIMYRPIRTNARPAILVLGGSEGGISGRDVAAQLAARGYPSLALAYFGARGLPAELESIPLERFSAALDYLARQPGVDGRRLGVLGTSKGAEAALLLATVDSRVRAVVGYAPSAVSWSCICTRGDAPSWTWAGQPVPYVPPGRDPAYQPPAGAASRPAMHYRYRVRDTSTVERTRILADRIGAPILLVSGGDDGMWPSQWSGEHIVSRGVVVDGRPSVRHLVYGDAGHLIGKSYLPAGSTHVAGGRIDTGGTPAANAAAQADAWPRVMSFLANVLR